MQNKNIYASNIAHIQILAVITIGSLVWLLSIPALAAVPGGDKIDWFKLGMGLFGGLAVFLIGIEQLSGSLQAAAGEKLKVLLAKLTKNKFMGALTGAGVTALLNSSTVTTVLVVRMAQDVRAMQEEVKQTVQMALKHQSTRLTNAEAGRLAGFRFEMEALDKLERPDKLTRRIANKVLPTELFLEQAEYIAKRRRGYVA